MGMKNPVPDPFEREGLEKVQPMVGFPPYSELLDNDNRRSLGRKIDVVNQLDPEKNFLSADRLIEFMNADEEGPNYLIIETTLNCRSQFQLDELSAPVSTYQLPTSSPDIWHIRSTLFFIFNPGPIIWDSSSPPRRKRVDFKRKQLLN